MFLNFLFMYLIKHKSDLLRLTCSQLVNMLTLPSAKVIINMTDFPIALTDIEVYAKRQRSYRTSEMRRYRINSSNGSVKIK